MMSEKVMAAPREEIRPISTESVKAFVDIAAERAETINATLSNICDFLNAEAFKEYVSNDHKWTDVIDLKTQTARLLEVTESSAELVEIIVRSLGM